MEGYHEDSEDFDSDSDRDHSSRTPESDSGSKFYGAGVEDCEDLERYEPGGFCPVHLHDTYDQDRYKVTGKLGYGGYATIWLARDLLDESWTALKFIVADESATYSSREAAILEDPVICASSFVVKTKRSFFVDGANGRHLCLAMPVVGTSLSTLSSGIWSRLRPAFAVELSLQASQAMSLLHSRNICHGDFTANNLALALSMEAQVHGETNLTELLGPPKTAPVVSTREGTSPEPHAPRYAVDTLDFRMASVKILSSNLRVFDFDQCFRSNAAPEKNGTPAKYMAPEVICGNPPSKASDVWTLGCTIYRLRSGEDLFFDFDTSSPADALLEIHRFLGDVPDNLAHTKFDEDGYYAKGEDGKLLDFFLDRISIEEKISTIYDAPPSSKMTSKGQVDTGQFKPITDDWRPKTSSRGELKIPYPSVYDSMLWKPTAICVEGRYLSGYGPGADEKFFVGAFPKMRQEEATLLRDLLSRIFVYDPAKRITAEEVCKHPWFSFYGDWNGL